MKKHKSVVAILLAVMMIFTMMPTMVFATNQQSATSWTDKVATMTDKDGDTFNTTRTFDGGLIEAKGIGNTTVVPATVAPSDGVFFTDFDSSMLTFNNGVKLDATTWKQAQFNNHGLELTLIQPDYAAGYDAKNPLKTTVAFAGNDKTVDEKTGVTTWTHVVNGWTVTVEESKYEAGLEADQTVTFKVSVAPINEVKGTEEAPDAFGKTADATVTVKGENKVPTTAKIYLDAVGGVECTGTGLAGGTLTGLYDGDAHTVVTDTVPGYTVSYETYDASTGKWAAATSVSITDVQAPGKEIRFRVVYTKDNVPTKTNEIRLNLTTANGAFYGFVPDREDGFIYGVSGTEYNAADYLAVVPVEIYDPDVQETAAAKKAAKAEDAATAKAVAKNEAQIKEYFDAKYEVKADKSKYNDDVVLLSLVKKDLSTEEEAAIEKKYEALKQNVGALTVNPNALYADVYLNGRDYRDFRVSFTKSVNAKTYKGKKLIKKAKLKKNQTITFKAACENGTNVKYKISGNTASGKITIDKKTGKVTVKKGLKKGTYKVKVTAYVPTDENAATAEFAADTADLKIVVKKK